MSGTRVVVYVETECEPGYCFDKHIYCGKREMERRQLEPGQFVLVEKVGEEWPQRRVADIAYALADYHRDFEDQGSYAHWFDPARVALNALADTDHTEGTP